MASCFSCRHTNYFLILFLSTNAILLFYLVDTIINDYKNHHSYWIKLPLATCSGGAKARPPWAGGRAHLVNALGQHVKHGVALLIGLSFI
jgi:hypothetical protein